MRILGVELAREPRADQPAERTLVVLAEDGSVVGIQRLETLPAVAAAIGSLVGEEPFLLGVDVPVVVPPKVARSRPVESLIRRRLAYRLPPGGRAAAGASPLGVAGEALIAGLATAGLPCLPYPDRDKRKSGLAETHAGLILKALLWETSALAADRDPQTLEQLFRSYTPPPYHRARLPARATWSDQAVALEQILRLLSAVVDGFDFSVVWNELSAANSRAGVERGCALLDAVLIAGTARRYTISPEQCLFVGDPSGGYLILPANGFVRRLALGGEKQPHGELFPQDSLRQRLGDAATLRSTDLLTVPGRPQRIEATFESDPRYEFDNLDEMLWWKHCRHLAGPRLPTEGLFELLVRLDAVEGRATPAALRLVRSRHRTLSFRFDPPGTWRTHVPPRDGRTYPFRIVRAVYETLPERD